MNNASRVLKALSCGHMLQRRELARLTGLTEKEVFQALFTLRDAGKAGGRNGYWWSVPPADRRGVQRQPRDEAKKDAN